MVPGVVGSVMITVVVLPVMPSVVSVVLSVVTFAKVVGSAVVVGSASRSEM